MWSLPDSGAGNRTRPAYTPYTGHGRVIRCYKTVDGKAGGLFFRTSDAAL